jgi:hypothetical protein
MRFLQGASDHLGIVDRRNQSTGNPRRDNIRTRLLEQEGD